MQDNAISLSELTSQVKSVLIDQMGGLYWVVVEIAEMKVNGMSGHCYLEFIEKDEGNKTLARVRATIWAAQYRMIKPYFESTTGQFLEQGLKVMVRVTLEFHEVYGLSLNIRDIDPSYTLGDLSKRRMEILAQLEEDGVLDMNKELEFPALPQRIAVISSSNAAGYEDFLEQLLDNEGDFHFSIKLFNAVMQGDGAALSVMDALDKIFLDHEDFDCVVIVRGGGATLDLTCFDDYDLAYLITQFPIPVLSGIGHQKDDTITDLVSYCKLKTPTAVAAYLVDHMLQAEAYLDSLIQSVAENAEIFIESEVKRIELIGLKLPGLIQGRIKDSEMRLHRIAEKMPFAGGEFLHERNHELIRLGDRLKNGATIKLSEKQNQLAKTNGEIRIKSRHLIERKQSRLDALMLKTQMMDPDTLLKRGYSITTKNGKVVKGASQLKDGDLIETRLHKGSVKSKVKK